MELNCYFARLLPPRPTFPADMTPEEGATMKAHLDYWNEHQAQGRVIVFGPVLDPRGVFGMGVVKVANEAELHEMLDNDPVTTSGLGSWEYAPMRAVVQG